MIRRLLAVSVVCMCAVTAAHAASFERVGTASTNKTKSFVTSASKSKVPSKSSAKKSSSNTDTTALPRVSTRNVKCNQDTVTFEVHVVLPSDKRYQRKKLTTTCVKKNGAQGNWVASKDASTHVFAKVEVTGGAPTKPKPKTNKGRSFTESLKSFFAPSTQKTTPKKSPSAAPLKESAVCELKKEKLAFYIDIGKDNKPKILVQCGKQDKASDATVQDISGGGYQGPGDNGSAPDNNQDYNTGQPNSDAQGGQPDWTKQSAEDAAGGAQPTDNGQPQQNVNHGTGGDAGRNGGTYNGDGRYGDSSPYGKDGQYGEYSRDKLGKDGLSEVQVSSEGDYKTEGDGQFSGEDDYFGEDDNEQYDDRQYASNDGTGGKANPDDFSSPINDSTDKAGDGDARALEQVYNYADYRDSRYDDASLLDGFFASEQQPGIAIEGTRERDYSYEVLEFDRKFDGSDWYSAYQQTTSFQEMQEYCTYAEDDVVECAYDQMTPDDYDIIGSIYAQNQSNWMFADNFLPPEPEPQCSWYSCWWYSVTDWWGTTNPNSGKYDQ